MWEINRQHNPHNYGSRHYHALCLISTNGEYLVNYRRLSEFYQLAFITYTSTTYIYIYIYIYIYNLYLLLDRVILIWSRSSSLSYINAHQSQQFCSGLLYAYVLLILTYFSTNEVSSYNDIILFLMHTWTSRAFMQSIKSYIILLSWASGEPHHSGFKSQFLALSLWCVMFLVWQFL
jgi:hypothetical protein